MDNLKLPAYPQPITMGSEGDILIPVMHHPDFGGFTKLEYASLMIAQGIAQREFVDTGDRDYISMRAVKLAKAVLEEANK